MQELVEAKYTPELAVVCGPSGFLQKLFLCPVDMIMSEYFAHDDGRKPPEPDAGKQ